MYRTLCTASGCLEVVGVNRMDDGPAKCVAHVSSEFKSISKAEFIRRMTVGSSWTYADVSDRPVVPRTTTRIVRKATTHQIVFDADGRNSYLTFYAGDKCEANDSGVLRITPGENPKVTIQYTPNA